MSYRFDSYDQSLVIEGFENGIADSPYTGISDMRNVNNVSVPTEASVNFATQLSTKAASGSGSVSSANPTTYYLSFGGAANLTNGQAITFTAQSGLGVTNGQVYWVTNVNVLNGLFQITSDFQQNTIVHVTNGTANFTSVAIQQPKYFTKDNASAYWLVDARGQVWYLAAIGNTLGWRYTGNSVPNTAYTNGNGIVYYEGNNGDGAAVGYIFVIHNSSIDFTPTAYANISWSYQWNPNAGTVGTYNATPTKVLKNSLTATNSHEAILGPDNKVYFCDANWVDRFYQTSTSTKFVPTTLATYTFDQTKVLPFNDIANCLAPLGSSLLVGGSLNVIYPWDMVSQQPSYPIFIAENNIYKMITVNTNVYFLAGNRGRIYITNGSQATLYKKIPDHISGTVEPFFIWGGLTTLKNQIYLSFYVTDNNGNAINQYGGLWAIDVDTEALRLTNKLSYGTYAGFASALIAMSGTPSGSGGGLYAGWDATATGAVNAGPYGIDATIGTPYVASEATIDSDLIPIGTYNKPRDLTQIEYKLAKPLVAGESISVKTRLIFNTQDTGYNSTPTLTDSTVGNFSNTSNIDFKNAQWVQFKIVLNSTATTPSFVRLKQLRILGLTGPTLATTQQFSI